ncbi:MAG: hypothetical protein V1736_08750 [Pseudomonadota bacterium]
MDGYKINAVGIPQTPPVERVPQSKEVMERKKVTREKKEDRGMQRETEENAKQDNAEGEKSPEKEQGRLVDIVV